MSDIFSYEWDGTAFVNVKIEIEDSDNYIVPTTYTFKVKVMARVYDGVNLLSNGAFLTHTDATAADFETF